MKTNQGFTLIEVLIAAVILFSSLAITAQLYSASSLSAEKAANTAQYYQSAELVITNIKSQLRERYQTTKQKEYSGVTQAFGFEFEWQATTQTMITPPMEVDEDFPPDARFPIFVVEVEAPKSGRSFQFRVVAW
ncbi:type II secretion system GspH family protein [Pseudoalteromonas sp. N1230-9]|uniref:PilW family protein n=1 Tax=unclassified Pseudoalteromonas TaxID=194690 RepID=UPI001023D5FE|nr:type II secretion system protein [Pseudoalteromonas sp. CO302Y]RZG07062.1 type II secretion system protein [Pseudoalteromonas sp. CO133X]WOC26640.1 type II secretion system GspH family protein [Pseudoalteromonas sp. N1230-9]